MDTHNELLDKISAADNFINKTYLNNLNKCAALPVPDYEKKFNTIRMFRLSKIVYDDSEAMDERLVSVFHSVMPFVKSLFLIINGKGNYSEIYLGVKSSIAGNAAVAGNVLYDSFLGNFPGTKLDAIQTQNIEAVVSEQNIHGYLPKSIASLSMIPSERGKSNSYVQGLEKFIDTMRGYEYTVKIIASPKNVQDIENRRQGLEDIYSGLSPFAKETNAHGVNLSKSATEGINESISKSISDGISKAIGQTDGYNHGTNAGHNVGYHFLLSFGNSKGYTEGWSASSNRTDTSSTNRTSTDTFSRQLSNTKTEGTTDNLTVEYRNKTVENILEKIDKHLARIKQGESYGIWEAATFFSGDKKTVAMASGVFSSLLAGDESGIENVNISFFDENESNTKYIEEALRYCQFPLFKIPLNEMQYSFGESFIANPSCYINGRELAMLMSMPRKSTPGINVIQSAEFGRNPAKLSESSERYISMGNLYHMGCVEETIVNLNLNSLTGHCFITGSTGSGKSNTVYKLIENISSEAYKIPFLVIEPAKGEYRDEFRKLPGINLFSTNPLLDQMLKINPFSFCKEIHVLEHLDRLVEIFNGCWEMYAAMPAILKEAMEKAYVEKGWDLLNSVYIGSGAVSYPTFADVLAQLPKIINSSQYSSDTKGDYIGALVTRVNSMTNGIYGQIFCDEIEVSEKELFDENAVVDLSRVGSAETKSLLMGIIILKLSEYRMAKAEGGNSDLKHITVLEEAHNILKNTKNGYSQTGNSNVIAKSVEMIVNSIAEMRTYGEGFVIVDQSPTSVDIAAIKNTNTKVIMRLPEKDDCELAGKSVSLNERQIDELSKLETGVAVVMQNNWELPVLSKIHVASHSTYLRQDFCSFSEMKRFRSQLLSDVLEQFVDSDERDVEKILTHIDCADISDYKKPEYKRLIRQFAMRIGDGFDSRLVGNTLLHLASCNDIFKNTEHLLEYELLDEREGEYINNYSDKSVEEWYVHIGMLLPVYVECTEEHMELIKQYIIFSKQFENHDISYSTLYKQLYSGVK